MKLDPCNTTSLLRISSFCKNFSVFAMKNDGKGTRAHSDTIERCCVIQVFLLLKQQAVTVVLAHILPPVNDFIFYIEHQTSKLKMLVLNLGNNI